MPLHDNCPANSCCYCRYWLSQSQEHGICTNNLSQDNFGFNTLDTDNCEEFEKAPDSRHVYKS